MKKLVDHSHMRMCTLSNMHVLRMLTFGNSKFSISNQKKQILANTCSLITELWANQDLCMDFLDPYNDHNTPGEHLEDMLSKRITYDFVQVSGKTPKDRITSRNQRRKVLGNALHLASTTPDSIAIVCDVSVPSSKSTTLQSVAGWDCCYLGERIGLEEWAACRMSTSDDAETVAISHDIVSISHMLPDLSSIHVFSDSFNVMHNVLNTSLHSAQSHSLRTLDCIWPWLEDSPDTHIIFHYVLEVVSLPEHNLVHL